MISALGCTSGASSTAAFTAEQHSSDTISNTAVTLSRVYVLTVAQQY
jgi:hypothetical protein